MLIEKAYLELYPEGKIGDYDFSIKYSTRFNYYNANVRKRGRKIDFKLSKKWQQINDDVKIGLVQTLLNKILKTQTNTRNMEIYEIFLKKVHVTVPKNITDTELEDSYNRVNDIYLYGLIEKPNLKWGTQSFQKLGHYEYGSDTIVISTLFRGADLDILDYVMYHELLHKKHKFSTKNGRTRQHTKLFKLDEKKFKNISKVEAKLDLLIKSKRRILEKDKRNA